MKIDVHVHSSYSSDASSSPEEILRYARKIKLDGIAITDHNEIKGSLRLWQDTRESEDIVVIPGMEVSSIAGHILALGITEPVPRDLDPMETIERIDDLGGLAVAPHPYRFWSGLGENTVRKSTFEGVEVINSRSLRRENKRAKKLARGLGRGETGGSDCHSLEYLGRAYTELYIESSDIDDILEQIRKRKSDGRGWDRRRIETIRYAGSCVYLWLRRGMKRM